MTGWMTCEHCKGVGKTFKWLIFPMECYYCKGIGYVWADNVEEYFRSLTEYKKKEMKDI